MPYIPHQFRDPLEPKETPTNPGELNYAISRLIARYIDLRGYRYQYINDALGALEGAKLELYRRIAAPYENGKLAENGDVYGPLNPTQETQPHVASTL